MTFYVLGANGFTQIIPEILIIISGVPLRYYHLPKVSYNTTVLGNYLCHERSTPCTKEWGVIGDLGCVHSILKNTKTRLCL